MQPRFRRAASDLLPLAVVGVLFVLAVLLGGQMLTHSG